MKKLLSTLLALALLLTGIGAVSLADETTEMTTIKILGFERQIADNASFANRDSQAIYKEAERMFNENGIALEYEIVADQDQYKTTIQTRLASNYNLPDLCYLGTLADQDVLDLADQGVILKMNDVLALTKGNAYNYFYGGEGEIARNTISDVNGDFYWLPRIQINQLNGQNAGTSMGACIRMDWLNTLNLAVPSTLDEFTQALQAFQDNDMNGNGVKDEVAVLDTSRFENGLNYWFGMVNGGSSGVGVNVTAGTVECAWYSPVVKEYFTYVQSLISSGLLYADAIGSDASTSQLETENKVSALYYYPVGTYIEAPIRAAGHEDAYYIGIKPFAAADGVTGFYSEETPYLVYLKYGVTNAASEKLEAVAKFYDTIYSEDFLNLMIFGIEGKTYEVVDGVKKKTFIAASSADLFDQGIIGFDALCRFFFPTVYHNERLDEIESTRAAGWPEKADFEMETVGSPAITPNDNSGYYALPTAEESETLLEYTTDLETYSRELAANLSLGRASLDELDTYIAEMKEMGLDEIIAVRQAQLDRRNGK